jgi:hypothetical protein
MGRVWHGIARYAGKETEDAPRGERVTRESEREKERERERKSEGRMSGRELRLMVSW